MLFICILPLLDTDILNRFQSHDNINRAISMLFRYNELKWKHNIYTMLNIHKITVAVLCAVCNMSRTVIHNTTNIVRNLHELAFIIEKVSEPSIIRQHYMFSNIIYATSDAVHIITYIIDSLLQYLIC